MVLLTPFFCARENYDVLALNLNETITRIKVTVPLKSRAFMSNTRVGFGAGLSGAYEGPPVKVDARQKGDRTGALN